MLTCLLQLHLLLQWSEVGEVGREEGSIADKGAKEEEVEEEEEEEEADAATQRWACLLQCRVSVHVISCRSSATVTA